MNTFALEHPAVKAYLQRLDAATAHLPADERSEIAEGIRSHLVTALGDAHSEADVRTTLDQLGDPEEIVGTPPPGSPPSTAVQPQRSARGVLEIVAVIFLLVGAVIVPVAGWFIGVVLLWVSKAWTVREKLLGTFIVPGGLALAPLFGGFVFAFAAPSCAGSTATESVTSEGAVATTGVLTSGGCSSGFPEWIALAALAFLVVGPLVTGVYLLRAAGRRPATT